MAAPNASTSYDQAIAGYQNAIGTARAAGASGRGMYDQLFNQQAQYGASLKLGLSQQYQQALAQNQQSALAAGLGNSTVLQAGQRGVNYDYANSLLTLNDQLYNRQNQIRQAELGYIAGNQQNVTQLQGALAGYQGAYAQQQAQIQAQYGLAGIQGQYGLQQQQLQNAGQIGQMQLANQFAQQQAGQQFGYGQANAAQNAYLQAGLANQQYGQQSSLSAQQYAQNAAMQGAQFAQQNYAADQFGYY